MTVNHSRLFDPTQVTTRRLSSSFSRPLNDCASNIKPDVYCSGFRISYTSADEIPPADEKKSGCHNNHFTIRTLSSTAYMNNNYIGFY